MKTASTDDRSVAGSRPGVPARLPAKSAARGGALLVAVLAAAAVAGGCSVLGAPAPDASRYYVLSSTDGSTITAPARTRGDIHFGLGPVKLPGYLDTQALVRTGASGSVEYVPNAFWAEPVSNAFSRALLYRTGARLGTNHAIAFPWYSTTRVDWKVPVDVLRFEATDHGKVVLVARWSVENTKDGSIVGSAESAFEETGGKDAAATVEALSHCIDRLAEAIAAAVATAADAAPAKAPPAKAKGATSPALSASPASPAASVARARTAIAAAPSRPSARASSGDSASKAGSAPAPFANGLVHGPGGDAPPRDIAPAPVAPATAQ